MLKALFIFDYLSLSSNLRFLSFYVINNGFFVFSIYFLNFIYFTGDRKMCLIFNGLDSEVFLADERKKMKETLEFFITSSRRLSGTVGLFHLCEFLNLANIIFQVKSQLNSSLTVLSIIFSS
jgi:hypothetical protein